MKPGRVAELRRQHRTDQRPGAGDGREVVAEQHPAAGRVVVVRRRTSVCAGVTRESSSDHHLGGDERAVVAVGDRQDAERRHDDVESMHGVRFYQRSRQWRSA